MILKGIEFTNKFRKKSLILRRMASFCTKRYIELFSIWIVEVWTHKKNHKWYLYCMNIFFPGIFFCEIAHYEFPFQFHPQIPGIRFTIPLPVRNRPSHSCSRSQDQKDIPVHPCFQCWIKTTFPSVGTERVVRLILGSQRNFAITASASHQLFSCCRFSTAIWIYKILS